VPGFGDPAARIVLVGLAPAAHGANRTGRMFTGDRSGDFLFAALHRAGLASSPRSVSRDDGLRLRGAFITAAARCAPPDNRPAPDELARCAPFLDAELSLLVQVRVVLALGAIAWDAVLRRLARERSTAARPQPLPGPPAGRGRSAAARPPASPAPAGGRLDRAAPRPRPPFGHGAEWPVPSHPVLLGSYHPSQQNTQTGRLTPEMLDAVLQRAVELACLGRKA
jgi:uracil-DNA glycosylase family 4